MAINFNSFGITVNSKGAVGNLNGGVLELVCPTLDVKSQAFPRLFLYRYMDVGIPPSTVVLPKVQPPWFPKFPKRA